MVLLRPASVSASPAVHETIAKYGFSLWHGLASLFLSIGALVVGILVGRKADHSANSKGSPGIPLLKFDALWLQVIGFGRQLTYLIQNGSLRFYTS